MTVPSEVSRSTYTGNGATTTFSTGFYFQASDEVLVRYTPSGGVEVVWVEGVDYTVATPVLGSGDVGSITATVAPAASSTLIIERDVELVQETSFRTQGSFSPAVHEDTFDRIVFQIQELRRQLVDLEASIGVAGDVAAGSGLFSTGSNPATFHVGAGDGIIANADDIEVDYGAGAAMNVVASDASTANEGSSPKAARIDHQHVALTAAPVGIDVGDAQAVGVSVALARADHQHALPAPAAPANVDVTAASAGVASTVARADHKHSVNTAAAVEITDSTNSAGVATTLARSDHGHSHGVRGGGTLHAVATGVDAGFMSAADKSSMIAIGTVALKSKVNAYQAAAQSIPTGLGVGALLTNYTETLDANGEFDPATGVYTAKDAGNLLIAAQITSAAAAWPGGNRVYLGIRKNGTTIGVVTVHFVDVVINRIAVVEAVRFVPVVLGDTIDLYVSHDQGGNVNFSGYLSIARFV